jgi:hypothetical protein
MEKTVMLILIRSRQDAAGKVQSILTAWGCHIRTRLGLHGGTLDQCTDDGLVFLELVGPKDRHEEMARKLNLLEGVRAELVHLALAD